MDLRDKLTLSDFKFLVLENESIEIPHIYWERVKESHHLLERVLKDKKAHYGINTGFGQLANKRIGEDKLDKLQEHLILSHSAGVGCDLPLDIVKGAMFLRLFCFLKGKSGVREQIPKMLHSMIEKGVIPAVPSKGSVGASGDLAPSAHIALVLLGKGFAYYKGKRISGSEALKKNELEPVRLEAKEGLSLINGTQFMTSIAALSLIRSKRLIQYADYLAASSIECIGGRKEPFEPEIHKVRPYQGQIESASTILRLLNHSKIKRSERVQDPYSFRCSPQVHGAIKEVIKFCEAMTEIEMNAVTDNPLLFEDRVLSGGNFHGEPVAFVIDFMKIALTELSSISERRTAHLMDPDITNLEPFLTKDPGINSGYMIPHTTSASLVSRNKSLSYPSVVDSIPTSLNQEDHVSMGMNGALSLLETVENTAYVLAIELLSATQGLRMKDWEKAAPGIKEFLSTVKEIIPPYDIDREHYNDIETVKDLILNGKL
ncbi:histidine ammonia-lyase [candidate division WOR-3 bacterium]|nr:histidine ammonia-lyase [candidate division WOR-3 bacterium]MCK4529187.1 histidine ammonia-lyase [candidate division WOR-3 bacterium]